VKRTYTSKLSFMYGVLLQKAPAGAGACLYLSVKTQA